jgi:glycine/D-amino acid oxidase-like deaminating enzyme
VRRTSARREELARLVMAAKPVPFWLDRADMPTAREPLRGDLACDLAVIGGGFGGLWAALLAKEANPGRSVVLIEGNRVGRAASGRNGGFCDASLTHGTANGRARFHYYRLTADNRILWGGYEAIYHFGRQVRRAYDQRPATFVKLAEHLYATFPQLEGIGFSHRWGGAIDTCSRFCAFFGTAHRGRVGYALGYTGLGVGASRFGARVVLDMLSGAPTELTQLEMVRSRPVPFPPEPLAYLGVQATRWSLAQADRRAGRRNLWLRTLDAAGLGFGS